MKASNCMALCLVMLTQSLFANGGGYMRGGVEKAGDIAGFEPSETEKIHMLNEQLTVSLGPKEADVEIRYLMRNETDKKVKVRFGFPVEESFDQDEMMDIEVPREAQPKEKITLKYCQNYTITAAGKPISAKWQAEDKVVTVNVDKRFKGIEGWLVSEITFAANEEKSVIIHFKSGYPLEHWSVSDDTSETAGIFRYRLSTAECWAGPIGTGRITLKPAGIDPNELKVLKPVNRFKKEGDNWVWNFENLEPTLSDDFEVEAKPEIKSYGRAYTQRGKQWFITHSNYEVKASSTLAPANGQSYEAEKVKDWYHEAWSEGAPGPGKGEWLELTPIAPKPLSAIEILPGYSKTEELFKANARPKKVLVELNNEHQFIIDFPDSIEARKIPIINYKKAVKKIRLTFQDVWPGERFEDLCVSGVRLEVKLDKEPKITPAR
jgi:hypothetical protein